MGTMIIILIFRSRRRCTCFVYSRRRVTEIVYNIIRNSECTKNQSLKTLVDDKFNVSSGEIFVPVPVFSDVDRENLTTLQQ